MKVDPLWSIAPEGTEFMVEFTDGEVHYYTTLGGELMVCTPLTFDEESLCGEVVGWRKSDFTDLNDLTTTEEYGRKGIYFKQL